jgi:hypothetical protein
MRRTWIRLALVGWLIGLMLAAPALAEIAR